MLAVLALVVGLACARLPNLPGSSQPGTVEGRVLSGEGAPPGSWVVVYLEGPPPGGSRVAAGPAPALRSRNGALEPELVAISAGQTVTLASDDALHHRFFSSSRPQGFDPVDVPSGESRELRMTLPSVVRVYCSLHPQEQGTIVVAPSRYYSALRAPGRYVLRDVPPGEYALHAWSESQVDEVRPVRVSRGESTIVEIRLGPGRDS